ncbi:hypothetical protein [Blastococcus saxobsidens]|nr:hypothetical protein [Blastococcus saxobsidens]
MNPVPEDREALWPSRHLTDGRLVILRGTENPHQTGQYATPEWVEQVRDWALSLDWLAWCGREWLRLSTGQQWGIGVLLFLFTGGIALLLPLAGVLLHRYREDHPRGEQPVTAAPVSPEATLAAWDTTEARVAGAASRAWLETMREPAWHSPLLAQSRAAFDGRAEVDQIIDLALRIRTARASLGARPTGPAAEYWDRQHEALEGAARQLGQRADALIRYRDQAAQFSAELQQLSELERLERSAAEIDGLTAETAYPSGRGDAGMQSLTEEIAGIRMAMTELVDLMTRTRAPLDQPPDPMPGAR